MSTKACSKCEKVRPISDFAPIKNTNRYRSSCRPCDREKCREYKARNREKVAAYNKVYKSVHKDEISVYNHEYNKEHREEITARQTRTRRERRATDPNFYQATHLRTKLCDAIRYGIDDDDDLIVLLGCELDDFLDWIEYQFDENMTMDNYGKYWTLDHVNPCSNFDLTKLENQVICFNWSNIRPIEKIQNQKKNNKVDIDEINLHRQVAKKFAKTFDDATKERYIFVF